MKTKQLIAKIDLETDDLVKAHQKRLGVTGETMSKIAYGNIAETERRLQAGEKAAAKATRAPRGRAAKK